MKPAPLVARNRRFELRRPFDATFRGLVVRVVELSERGARIVHDDPLVADLIGSLVVAVPSAPLVTLRARVVWSRALPTSRFESGLTFAAERPDRAADLLDHLVRLGWAGTTGPRAARNRVSDAGGDLGAARQALEFLSRNRSVSARWKRLVERDLPSTNGYPVEVVAAWELLGRAIDVETVARAHRESNPFELDGNALLEEEVGFALVEA